MTSTTKNTVPVAGASFLSDLQNFLREEDPDRFRDMFTGFIVSGGTHATGAGLVHTPASLTAYPGGHFITETGAITYPDSATHIWVICHKDTTTAVTDWTRVSGTHYLFRNTGSATRPALPVPESTILMKVTTSGGAVTVVEDHRIVTFEPTRSATEVVFNDSGADLDFRVEGDTSTHLLFLDASANRAGVSLSGNLVTDGLFHISSGSAGSIAAKANADELVLEGSGTNVGMSILGPKTGTIRWSGGNPTDGNDDFEMRYSNTNRELFFDVGGNNSILTLGATGLIFNDLGLAAQDFRIEGDTSTHLFFLDASANRSGVSLTGNLVTDGLFHVAHSTAGSVTASANANTLVIEGDAVASRGLSILTPVTGFADAVVAVSLSVWV